MKISIALATYNGEQYLQEQLNSFEQQTRLPDELVVSDDASTDSTVSILRAFSSTAPFRVTILTSDENVGYTENFNRALLRTSGDLVFLSDQDDVWFPNKISIIADVAAANPDAYGFINDARLTDQYLNDTGLTALGQTRAAGHANEDYLIGCCSAFRREFLGICLPIPRGFFGHDSWLADLSNAMNARLVVDQVLQSYRRHDTNISFAAVNNTKPNSRVNVTLNWWWQLLQGQFKPAPANRHANNPRLLAEHLPRMIELAPANRRPILRRYLEAKSHEHRVRLMRGDLRKRGFIDRVIGSYLLGSRGDYPDRFWLKNLLRDVFPPK